MRSQIVLIISLAITLFNGVQLFAQSNSGSKGPPIPDSNRTPGGPGPPVEAMIPIDDNILILLLAGLILGVYYFDRVRATTKKVA
jgi:hypothetical protein